jgi:hypothetical protein
VHTVVGIVEGNVWYIPEGGVKTAPWSVDDFADWHSPVADEPRKAEEITPEWLAEHGFEHAHTSLWTLCRNGFGVSVTSNGISIRIAGGMKWTEGQMTTERLTALWFGLTGERI